MENDPDQQPQVTGNPMPLAPIPDTPASRPKPKSRKKMLLIAGGAVLLLLAAGAAYWFLLREEPKKTPPPAANTQEQNPTDPAEFTADPTPVKYKSEKLNIELTHRKDWKLKEAADGQITLTSNPTSYSKADGESTTGPFTVKIRKGVTDAMQSTIDGSFASGSSEVIAYADPVKGQREYTNLSYVGPKEQFAFFIITSNTEFKAGASLQYALQFGADSFLIVGGYGSDAGNTLGFDAVPLEYMGTHGSDNEFAQALAIVESLKIY